MRCRREVVLGWFDGVFGAFFFVGGVIGGGLVGFCSIRRRRGGVLSTALLFPAMGKMMFMV